MAVYKIIPEREGKYDLVHFNHKSEIGRTICLQSATQKQLKYLFEHTGHPFVFKDEIPKKKKDIKQKRHEDGKKTVKKIKGG